MKTFIVYDLDSLMPVAVGEQVSAETARDCASEEPDFSRQIFSQKKLIWKNRLSTEPKRWKPGCRSPPRSSRTGHDM